MLQSSLILKKMVFLKRPSKTGKQKHVFLVADRSTHIVPPSEANRARAPSPPSLVGTIDWMAVAIPSIHAFGHNFLDLGLASSV